jgi:hypothetical protein
VLNASKERQAVARHPSRGELVTGLIRLGEQELTGEDQAEVDACFAPDFAFHGPDGAELDYEGKGYFASLRAAFDDLTISRGIMVVEGDYVACQTTIAGTFAREFTRSPVGRLPPNGSRVSARRRALARRAGDQPRDRAAVRRARDPRRQVGAAGGRGRLGGGRVHHDPARARLGAEEPRGAARQRVLLTALLAVLFTNLTHLTGLSSEEAIFL